MQECSSDSLLRSLLTEEIAQAGDRIARLVQPGSPIDRTRRREIRAFLREAFQCTQEESSIDKLTRIVERLRQLLLELGESQTKDLEQHVGRHQNFGVVDERLVDRGKGFCDTIHRNSEKIALDIEARMNRAGVVAGGDKEVEGGVSSQTRPLHTGQELMELVVKKHW